MRREVFEGREGYMNVGEAPGITPARNEFITNPAHKELDMLFLFDHVGVDQEGSKWNTVPFEVRNLRARLADQQEAVRNAGWASLFFCNHDQPRVVSRWGNDSDREARELSAKAFGMVLHMHRGTPYIYEGEELGMTNAHFTKLEQYRDLEALNGYRQRVEEAKCQSSESMMAALALIGRDNARTPMQWDASKYAGFTPADAAAEPWISVNPNHVEINAAEEFDDPDSVYGFYKKLIAMRHNSATVATGEWNLLAADDEQVYAFTRTGGDDTILVVVNLTDESAGLPGEVAELLGDGVGNLVKSDGKPQSVAASQLRWGFGGCDDSPVDQEQEVNQRYDEHDYGKQQHDAYPVSYTHLRAHETDSYLVCRLLLEKKKILSRMPSFA